MWLHGFQPVIESIGCNLLGTYFAFGKLNVKRRYGDAKFFQFFLGHIGCAIGYDFHFSLRLPIGYHFDGTSRQNKTPASNANAAPK